MALGGIEVEAPYFQCDGNMGQGNVDQVLPCAILNALENERTVQCEDNLSARSQHASLHERNQSKSTLTQLMYARYRSLK